MLVIIIYYYSRYDLHTRDCLLAAHFFFDDAFQAHEDEDFEYSANDFVKQFVRVIDRAAS